MGMRIQQQIQMNTGGARKDRAKDKGLFGRANMRIGVNREERTQKRQSHTTGE